MNSPLKSHGDLDDAGADEEEEEGKEEEEKEIEEEKGEEVLIASKPVSFTPARKPVAHGLHVECSALEAESNDDVLEVAKPTKVVISSIAPI